MILELKILWKKKIFLFCLRESHNVLNLEQDYRLNRKIQEYKSGDQRVAGWDEQGTEQPVEPTEVCIDNFKTHPPSGNQTSRKVFRV